jgi:hypothetical protein
VAAQKGGRPATPAVAGLPLGVCGLIFFHKRNRKVVAVKLCGQDQGVLTFHWRASLAALGALARPRCPKRITACGPVIFFADPR